MLGAPFVFLCTIHFRSALARSKWCGFVIVPRQPETTTACSIWTLFGHTAQFCRLWKLNKCVVILRVKIEIVFSLSRCLWMHSVHDNELWVSVCAWTLTVWDIVWQHKDYRIPRRCQCIIMFSIKNMRLFFITFNGENVREEMLTILMYLFLTHSNLTSTK